MQTARSHDAPARRILRRPRTRRALLLATLLFVGAMAGPARAEFVSSDQLYDWLTEAMRRGGSFKDATISLGFVIGVHDLIPEGEVCLPPKSSGKTLQAAVHQWMKTNDSQWDAVGARTVRRALAETFPCAGSQPP
jgi:hypothetical protein